MNAVLPTAACGNARSAPFASQRVAPPAGALEDEGASSSGCECDGLPPHTIVELTGPHPIRVSATGAQDLRLAMDVSDYDEIDIELCVLALEGTSPTVQITIETGMQCDTDHGWTALATFPLVSTAPATHLRRLRGMLRYIRWNVTTLGGTAPAATFLVDGVARSWPGSPRVPDRRARCRPERASSVPYGGVLSTYCDANPWPEEDVRCGALVPSPIHPTIQSALDAASDGATICVSAGVYHESLSITKNVSLVGSGGPESVHIYPSTRFGAAPRVITITRPNINVRLERMTLHDGNPTILTGPWLWHSIHGAPPILELRNVAILTSGTSGAIVGTLHVKATGLLVERSAGHGMAIIGSADVRNSRITNCAGYGASIDNSLETPEISASGPWVQQFCGACDHNGAGGLRIQNSGGRAFAIQGAFEYNTAHGIQLIGANETLINQTLVAYTYPPAQRAPAGGVAIALKGSSNVLIVESEVSANRIGILAVGCSSIGSTTASVSSSRFYGNHFHLARGADATCGPASVMKIFDLGGNICVPSPCKIHDLAPQLYSP